MLLKQNRLNYKNSLTLAYQLGYVIGERISTKVPVLSCDWLKTDNVIQITEEEMEHHESLDEKHYNSSKDKSINEEINKQLFKDYVNYRKELRKKYLPKTFDFFVSIINVSESDMSEFKKGIGRALWNGDRCHYSNENDDITVQDEEDLYFTEII